MLDDGKALKMVGRIFLNSGRTLGSMPAAVPQILVAIQYSLSAGRQIVVAGTLGASDARALLAQARKGFHPDQVILFADGGEGQAWLSEYVPSLAGMKTVNGQAALYLCENFTCTAPVTELASDALFI